jgi:hypothetical protein
MRDGGKGDRRRKLVVPEEQFNANWDAIFKKPVKTEQEFFDKAKEIAKKLDEQNIRKPNPHIGNSDKEPRAYKMGDIDWTKALK